MICVWLLLGFLPAAVRSNCILSKKKVERRNVKFMESTWNPDKSSDDPQKLQSQSTVEIMCSQEAYTFTNQVSLHALLNHDPSKPKCFNCRCI